MQQQSQTPLFFSEPFRCPSCRASFATFKQLLDHQEKPCYPDTGESGDSYDVELETLLGGHQVETFGKVGENKENK